MGSIFDENSEFLKYLKDNKDEKPKSDRTVQMHIGSEGELLHKSETSSKTDGYILDLKDKSLRDPRRATPILVKKEENTTFPEPSATNSKHSAGSQPQVPSPKLIKKIEKLSVPATPTTNLSGFIWDKFKFLLTTAIIFSVTFLAINWPAYSKIFSNWFNDLNGTSDTSPLKEFSSTSIAKAEDDKSEIPPLNLEVIPPGTRIIIPRLGSNVPIVSVSDEKLLTRNWGGLEKDIQDALRSGVVHYPGTPYPNQSGNVVLTGHSSYYPWDPGRFKDVFAVLHQAEIGDEIIVFHNQKKYFYKITSINKVLPTEVNVLGDSGDDRLTLITCTPIGTNLKRLIVTAKPVKS